jgi:transcriptional regulator
MVSLGRAVFWWETALFISRSDFQAALPVRQWIRILLTGFPAVPGFMFRKDLLKLLLDNPLSITQIGRIVREPPGQIADDLNHLLRSLKHTQYVAEIEPARYRACGFEFSAAKLNKPSKCPKCYSTWLAEPRIAIEQKR